MFLGELRPMCKSNHHAEAMRTPEALTISFHKKAPPMLITSAGHDVNNE
jgi:hypothetical protein